jgi:hypothetical protein
MHQIPRRLRVGLVEAVLQEVMRLLLRRIPVNNKAWVLEEKPKNLGIKGKQYEPHKKHGKRNNAKEVVIVINNQVAKRSKRKSISSATQVASGSGTYSTGGTNSAIESSNTKQQHAVGGGRGSRAINKLIKGKQKQAGLRRRKQSMR